LRSFEIALASFLVALLVACFGIREFLWALFIPFPIYFALAALSLRSHFARVRVFALSASVLHVLAYYADYTRAQPWNDATPWAALLALLASWALVWIPKGVPSLRRLFLPLPRNPKIASHMSSAQSAAESGESFRDLQEELRIARRESEAIVSAAGDMAVFRLNTEGLVESWNASAERVHGYAASEILGSEFSIFYPSGQKHGETLDTLLRSSLEKGLHREQGWRLRRGGTPFWALTSTLPIFDAEGQLGGFWQIVIDASERKRMERELRVAREAAQAAEKAKTTFLANLNHEIRTPLGGMLGFAELMANPHQSSADRADLLQLIKKNGEQLSSVIHDLLDLSRIESGREEIEALQFNLLDFIRDLSQRFRPLARAKSLRFDIVLESPIPEIVISDAARLRQILDNLIDNAIKFTDRGSVTLSLRLLHTTVSTSTTQLGFVVRDTGSGMNAEQRALLFKPFMPGDSSTTRKFAGTGLGLALARGLARAMGGDLFLTESIPDRGSTFTLALPVASFEDSPLIKQLPLEIALGEHWGENVARPRDGAAGGAANEKAPARDRAPYRSRPRKLEGMRILLVEDAPDNQLLTSKFLRMEGASVEIAQNGVEGVEKARDGDFDLVLMDIQMPIQDGYEATSRLRRGGYSKPIIALTARAMKEERQRCLRSGCDDHITKPIDRATLLNKILAHVQREPEMRI
jgi:PAS domain S-box-containing protein